MLTNALTEQQLENWIFHSDPAEVRQKFDQATGLQREMMEAIIVGFIVLGDCPLGQAFPEFP